MKNKSGKPVPWGMVERGGTLTWLINRVAETKPRREMELGEIYKMIILFFLILQWLLYFYQMENFNAISPNRMRPMNIDI